MLLPKHHPNLLHVDTAALVVIDMQEPFLRHIHEPKQLIHNICTLVQGANVLRLPVISTTQYAKQMGPVIDEIKTHLSPQRPPFDKLTFNCYADPGFASEIQRSGRKQVLLCGVETHICVSQTAHELQAAGFQVHVVADAVSSRTEMNWRMGLEKMGQGGVLTSSVEAALFELLDQAGTPEFRAILDLIK